MKRGNGSVKAGERPEPHDRTRRAASGRQDQSPRGPFSMSVITPLRTVTKRMNSFLPKL